MIALSDEELRVKVAEEDGWRREPSPYFPGVMLWISPDGKPAGRVTDFGNGVPDYPNDLNACADLRAGLSEEEKERFCQAVCEQLTLSGRGCFFDALNLTARDHCLAFLKCKGVEI